MCEPYTVDKNGNKSDYRIWESELKVEEYDDDDKEYHAYLRELHAAVKKEIAKRAALREQNTMEKP